MSYQVLARKWRPRTFHELVGQEHVQRALVNALDQGRLHHAYLFTGTRGVGKTTLARILAKCLNCTANGQGDAGVTSTPCGECDSCRSIDEGRFVDLIEVDAASRTKVEDTRELLDNVQYAPTQGRYKVYLIDEVHMLSTSSFNALLKTLEEPPPHVKFLLATTDPQKLPPTVLSRCLQFTLKHMPPERIVGHLAKVLEAEGVPFEESALWLLGKAAEGSMRDAMSLTDQAIAFGQGEVRHADVAAMLGTLDHRHVLALVEALAAVDAPRLLAEVAALAEQGPDFAAVLDDITGVLHRLAIAQMVPDAVDNGHGDREALLQLAARFTGEDIQLFYQIGIQGRGDMEHAPDLRTALEMTLLRMLAFRPQGVPRPAQTPLPMRGQGESGGAGSGGNTPPQDGEAPEKPPSPRPAQAAPEPPAEPPAASPPPDIPPPAPAAEAESAPSPDDTPPPWVEREEEGAAASAPAAPGGEPEPGMAAPSASHDPVATERPAQQAMAAPAAAEPHSPDPQAPDTQVAPAPVAEGHFGHADWLACFESLGLGGLTRNLAAHCVVEADDGEQLTLRLDPSQEAMQAEVHVTRIREALAAIGVERRLALAPGALPPEVETPRQQADRLAAQRHAEAIEALSRDPHVQKLQQAFGARLIESTVKPADAEARG
ncbi:DNA polymerase III gamma subunit /DNA polymerase III tau subunit [Halomonas ventosae]|uniref:DNA polymerase III subunit gamma/tau n=1 Tax=Halomonas ventosae TaxID=229007 RepID=A0A4R6ZS24_9GAMM|nr:DNA polymerase III subunit gamma/tau [Halomonas ventosae]TDR55014.1 DNA polymerase III gamma subunit /DNA polymerase III tau subunit [Halomonas ventosae]